MTTGRRGGRSRMRANRSIPGAGWCRQWREQTLGGQEKENGSSPTCRPPPLPPFPSSRPTRAASSVSSCSRLLAAIASSTAFPTNAASRASLPALAEASSAPNFFSRALRSLACRFAIRDRATPGYASASSISGSHPSRRSPLSFAAAAGPPPARARTPPPSAAVLNAASASSGRSPSPPPEKTCSRYLPMSVATYRPGACLASSGAASTRRRACATPPG